LIADPSKHFDTKLYAGTSATHNITMDNTSLSPDFVWIKARNDSNEGHYLYDSVRGANKPLYSHADAAEGSSTNQLNSFDTNGFTLGDNGAVNGGYTYVAWAWNAGSSTVTNNAGSIQSEVRASTTAGFSIVSWTNGTQPYTVGHGLNAIPSLMILKSRSTGNWPTYHASLGNQSRVYLNLTLAASSGEGCWNSTSPTSSVFSVGSSGEHTGDMIAYCFSSREGYSKFGSYTGTGVSNNYIHCGFAPALLIIKRKENGSDGDTTYGGWIMFDNKRTGANDQLFANCSQAEGGRGYCGGTNSLRQHVEFLSTGFVLSSGWYETNDPTDFIFCAWASSPFKYANAQLNG
jgi:hypothetical protein